MLRFEAERWLHHYTASTVAKMINEGKLTKRPLWSEQHDPAAECNRNRQEKFDQIDVIWSKLNNLTDLLLQVRNHTYLKIY